MTQSIKDLLHEWAGHHIERTEGGFPSECHYLKERVQDDNRRDYSMGPGVHPDVVKLDAAVEALAPAFKLIIRAEYRIRGMTQKSKSEDLGMAQPDYARRLKFIHEQLDYAVWGDSI